VCVCVRVCVCVCVCARLVRPRPSVSPSRCACASVTRVSALQVIVGPPKRIIGFGSFRFPLTRPRFTCRSLIHIIRVLYYIMCVCVHYRPSPVSVCCVPYIIIPIMLQHSADRHRCCCCWTLENNFSIYIHIIYSIVL